MARVLEYLRLLRRDEDGAVTVDWVVLTAVIVGLGTGAASVIGPAVKSGGNAISQVVVTAVTIPD